MTVKNDTNWIQQIIKFNYHKPKNKKKLKKTALNSTKTKTSKSQIINLSKEKKKQMYTCTLFSLWEQLLDFLFCQGIKPNGWHLILNLKCWL